MPHTDEFEAFVHATGNRLFRTAVLLCGDWHLAEDLLQTTYAKVYARWRRVSSAQEPLAYTRSMLLNTYLSHRRLRRSSESPSAELPESMLVIDPGLRLDLLEALRDLDPKDRAVLTLRFWEDFSVSETARLMGITEGAVRTRSSRATTKLRERLGADFLVTN